ncbi:MAG: TIM barrel protein [Candidatus Aenigmatarchaeota archaeon]
MKIFLGPAGIPTVAEDRTTEGGIKKVFELGLNAMEIEFVRNVYLDQKKAEEVGKFAKELGISLTVHAPYFINLLSDNKTTVEASKKRILESLDRAERMEAKAVVVHAAYYGNLPREEAFEKMVEITKEILEEARERGIKKTLLAYETMAKESQFAGLDELLELMKKVNSKQFTINVDFAHIFVRNNGKIDYGKILEKLKNFDHIYSHFSNVKYNVNTKRFADVHVPLNSHPAFKPLAEEILKKKVNITIISESPILEQDSLKMLQVFKKLESKFKL